MANDHCNGSDDAKRSLLERIKKYEYIRLSLPDLNGLHLSKLLSTRYAEKIVNGISEMYSGMITFGPRNEVVDVEEVVERKHLNNNLIPDPTTFHPCGWSRSATDADASVCGVLCELRWPDGRMMDAHPRVAVRKLLHRLEAEYGLVLYSAFEPEFRVFKQKDIELACCSPEVWRVVSKGETRRPEPIPFTRGQDMYKTSLLAIYEQFFQDIDKQMIRAGIEVQDFCNENGEGQLECPLLPQYGIAAADKYFILKQAVKEIAPKHGMVASFMTTPCNDISSSGCHFNHSLWDAKTKRNALYDQSKTDNLSDVARHWIGGLMEHFPAMSALCCPTVNCYRRLHKKLAPDMANWDISDRFVSVRVKNWDEKRTYFENRLPSSASCPYHVMAATLAAGMDGLKRKLEPPPPGQKSGSIPRLPDNLETALECLQKDKALIEQLGSTFVDWFIAVKTRADLVTLKDIKLPDSSEDPDLGLERYEYFEYI